MLGLGRTMGEFGEVWGKRVWRRPLVQAVTAHSTYAAVLDSLASNDPAPGGSKDRSFRLLGNMRKLELHRCLFKFVGHDEKVTRLGSAQLSVLAGQTVICSSLSVRPTHSDAYANARFYDS